MASKSLDTDTIKPALVAADEEIVEGRLDQFELEKDDENTNEEFSYESHRSPFPEGECKFKFRRN
jgi:hypothetical protein